MFEKLCNQSAKMSVSTPYTDPSIFDLPNEILIEIILYLNSGERIALANTSRRFYYLLRECKLPLRDLDVSKKKLLTSGTSLVDIERHFKNPKTSKHVPELNFWWTNPAIENQSNPPRTIKDLHTQTMYFEAIVQLGIFLYPFLHIERLSIEWPGGMMTIENNVDRFFAAWRTPFSRLKYLSVTISNETYMTGFLACLNLCQELRELRIVNRIDPDNMTSRLPYGSKLIVPLKNLEIVVFWGWFTHDYDMYKSIMLSLFTDPKELMQLRIESGFLTNGLYLRKSLQLAAMLGEPRCRSLSYDTLLHMILTQTHEIEQRDLHCLLEQNAEGGESIFRLKMEDVKLLLEAPKHEIRYLKLEHKIGPNCVVHLVASAFPNLTELVLSTVVKIKGLDAQKTHPIKRLRRKRDAEPADYWNVNKDSSFKMLVGNTPCLKNLSIIADPGFEYLSLCGLRDHEVWDLDALPLIAGWQNLRSLYLKSIPITNGEFLVEIAKRCQYLEKVKLLRLGPGGRCCYLNELNNMLSNCRNLKDFTIEQCGLGNISEMFRSLGSNREIERISIWTKERDNRSRNLKLVSPVEQLLYDCPKLTRFCFSDKAMSPSDMEKIRSAMLRLKDKLNRPTWRFEVDKKYVRIYSYQSPLTASYYCEDLMKYYFPETRYSAARIPWEIWSFCGDMFKGLWKFVKYSLGRQNSQ